jgi:hypothetical protein
MSWKHFKILSLLLITLVGGNLVIAQKDVYQSKLFTGLSPRDGKAYLDIMHYDKKSKFMYLIRNDNENLYIDILLGDQAAIQRTMMFGLTTWIDPQAKKKKNMGIVFPMEGNSGRGISPRSREGKDRKEMMALAMQEKNSRMLLKGFSGKGSEKEINPMVSQDIRGRFERLEGEKIRIVLTIPLTMIDMKPAAKDNLLSIGFQTGYMDLNRSGMAAGGGSRDRGGDYHAGRPGGGPPGGADGMESRGGEQQRMNLNEMATPSKMWIKKVMLTVDN